MLLQDFLLQAKQEELNVQRGKHSIKWKIISNLGVNGSRYGKQWLHISTSEGKT